MLDEMTALSIPQVHGQGLTGKDIVIGVLDSGFDNLTNTGCLKNTHILHTRNFIRGNTDVSGDRHGTWVLACIGGRLEGEYVAAAYGASFLLALTDDVSTETRADEDRWVAAVEWCDSLGADIISSSLVYNEFDTVAESYTKAQMDGRTSLVARAAEIAVSRGILVVNSVGNEGRTPWRTITTPGDAEHVISVGALSFSSSGEPTIAPFSSIGPTADGRIKPDVVAPGAEVSIPVAGTTGQYMVSSGTSFAAPLISGLCALLLEAHPEWIPAMVKEALKMSARDLGPSGPDNTYGWGLPNGLSALNASPATVADYGCIGNESFPASFSLGSPYPNPFNPAVAIPFRLSSPARVTVSVYDITGRLIAILYNGIAMTGEHRVIWNAGRQSSGVYLIRMNWGKRTEVRKALLVK
jgi:subtilisin family serine protease